MGKIIVVGPNTAAVVTQRRNKKIVTGSWVWVIPGFSNFQFLSLGLMTLKPNCVNVETAEGVPVSVSAIAQCKIMNTPQGLLIAAEQFLGKRSSQIGWAITQTLEGHLRAILGTLTVEEIYKDRIKFSNLVHVVAATDVAKMGIQIVSFVTKDIEDSVGYLSALGKARTAEVKRDAAIGVAYADRDAGIREAECEKEANAVIYEMQMNIQNYSRMYDLHKAQFDKEVNTAKAKSQLAYSLEMAKIQQQIRYEELIIDIVERKKLIEIEQKEIERKDRELVGTIELPSEAESYRIQTIAKAQKAVVIEDAVGESEKLKKIGEAEAFRIQTIGLKEADKMRRHAIVLQTYGDMAIKQLIMNSLPEIASKITAPLAKTDEIVILGGNNSSIAGNLPSLAAQIPPAMEALQIDMHKLTCKKSITKPI